MAVRGEIEPDVMSLPMRPTIDEVFEDAKQGRFDPGFRRAPSGQQADAPA